MIAIHETTRAQAGGILDLARNEPLFNTGEVAVVQELLNDYLDRPDHNGYFFLSALQHDNLIGFACYGPTPMTDGTFDLYWIAIATGSKGHGVGRQLLEEVERRIKDLGGRLLVLDTSGRPDYAGTRAFYERLGFERTAGIPDFYAQGDDLIIYTRRLS